MQFHEVTFDGAKPVDGYGPGFFRVDGTVLQSGILLTADKVQSWGGFDDLAPLIALAGQVDVLFVGTGANIAHAPKDLTNRLQDLGVGVEVMASDTACRTYNVILAEGRRIALAALPV